MESTNTASLSASALFVCYVDGIRAAFPPGTGIARKHLKNALCVQNVKRSNERLDGQPGFTLSASAATVWPDLDRFINMLHRHGGRLEAIELAFDFRLCSEESDRTTQALHLLAQHLIMIDGPRGPVRRKHDHSTIYWGGKSEPINLVGYGHRRSKRHPRQGYATHWELRFQGDDALHKIGLDPDDAWCLRSSIDGERIEDIIAGFIRTAPDPYQQQANVRRLSEGGRWRTRLHDDQERDRRGREFIMHALDEHTRNVKATAQAVDWALQARGQSWPSE